MAPCGVQLVQQGTRLEMTLIPWWSSCWTIITNIDWLCSFWGIKTFCVIICLSIWTSNYDCPRCSWFLRCWLIAMTEIGCVQLNLQGLRQLRELQELRECWFCGLLHPLRAYNFHLPMSPTCKVGSTELTCCVSQPCHALAIEWVVSW